MDLLNTTGFLRVTSPGPTNASSSDLPILRKHSVNGRFTVLLTKDSSYIPFSGELGRDLRLRLSYHLTLRSTLTNLYASKATDTARYLAVKPSLRKVATWVRLLQIHSVRQISGIRCPTSLTWAITKVCTISNPSSSVPKRAHFLVFFFFKGANLVIYLTFIFIHQVFSVASTLIHFTLQLSN